MQYTTVILDIDISPNTSTSTLIFVDIISPNPQLNKKTANSMSHAVFCVTKYVHSPHNFQINQINLHSSNLRLFAAYHILLKP